MKLITQIGATPQEAISLALQKLGKTLEQVDVEVLQEGKKGFFGFVGMIIGVPLWAVISRLFWELMDSKLRKKKLSTNVEDYSDK